MASKPNTLEELIESRTYLLGGQKERLIEDLELVETDEKHMETIVGAILYRLFDISWDDLTATEKMDIDFAWKSI